MVKMADDAAFIRPTPLRGCYCPVGARRRFHQVWDFGFSGGAAGGVARAGVLAGLTMAGAGVLAGLTMAGGCGAAGGMLSDGGVSTACGTAGMLATIAVAGGLAGGCATTTCS